MDLKPQFFVVSHRHGYNDYAIYHDELPQRMPRNVEYIIRLDQQPNAESLCRAPMSQLIETYKHLKARNKLPPRYEPPKPKKEPAADA